MDMNDRLPPHNLEAERQLLGGILRYPDAMLTLQLRADEFYSDAHQRIYRAMLDIAGARKPLDMVLLHEQLRRAGTIEDIGGVQYLTELWEREPTGANFEYHAAMIREAAIVRALIHAAHETLRDAYDRCDSAEGLAAQAERRFLAIGEQSATIADAVQGASGFMPAAAARIDDRIANGGKPQGLLSGFHDIDESIGGFKPGELNIIAARPSVGKTALAVNILERVAEAGTPVLLFSLAMPLAEIADRLLSMGSGVPLHRFTRASSLTAEESARIANASGPDGIGGYPIFVDDSSHSTAARVAAVTRRMVRRHGVGLVAIDYLGLMAPEDRRRQRWEQIGTLTQHVKGIARECRIPVLLLAQLNREVEGRNDPKPRLSDLRDSGEIEQHADRVIFLHRQQDLPNDQEVWPIDLTIAKQRNGPTGDLRLSYRRPVMRFEDAIPW